MYPPPPHNTFLPVTFGFFLYKLCLWALLLNGNIWEALSGGGGAEKKQHRLYLPPSNIFPTLFFLNYRYLLSFLKGQHHKIPYSVFKGTVSQDSLQDISTFPLGT